MILSLKIIDGETYTLNDRVNQYDIPIGKISEIVLKTKDFENYTPVQRYEIYVSKDQVKQPELWKIIENAPVEIEFKIL